VNLPTNLKKDSAIEATLAPFERIHGHLVDSEGRSVEDALIVSSACDAPLEVTELSLLEAITNRLCREAGKVARSRSWVRLQMACCSSMLERVGKLFTTVRPASSTFRRRSS
jgi:hypothetical protein